MGFTKTLQRLIRTSVSVAAKKPRRKAVVEQLEPRLLLDAAPVAVDDFYVTNEDVVLSSSAPGLLSKVNTRHAEQLCGVGSDLYADFGSGIGLYRYDGEAWTQISSMDAQGMTSVGSDLYVDFGPSGLYRYAGGALTRVNPNNVEQISGVGSTLYADFGSGIGLYQYDGSRWKKLNPNDAQGMTSVGSDLYVDFGPVGLYRYGGGGFTKVNPNDAVRIYGAGTDLYADFGAGIGLYQYNETGWKKVNPNSEQGMASVGSALYVDFGILGLYRYSNGVMRKVNANNAEGLQVAGNTLYVDFGSGIGLYEYDGTSWRKVSKSDAGSMGTAGSDLYVDFGTAGVYRHARGVLSNDSDLDGDLLSVVVVSGPSHGNLAFNSDGTFLYTPNPNFNGTDSFTYRASDGVLQSNVATVTITVKAVNDWPTAVGISDLIVNEDAPATVIDLSEFFADVDLPYGDELTYTVTASGSIPILALLDQISQASYTDIHQNLLYTHTGHNRGLTGAQHDPARTNIFNYFEDLGLETTLDPFPYNFKTYYNVVGVQPGATRPEDIYIIGAHYDSVNNPGADDNASGVAAVMEAARILSMFEFEATLVYIAFDREEQGLKGSWAYANEHVSDKILGVINFDMIAYNPAGANHNKVRIYDGDDPDEPIMQEMLDAFNLLDYGRGITAIDSGPIAQSDHYPFDELGFEAVLLIEYNVWSNPHYHKSTDAVETAGYIDYTFATSIAAGGAGYIVSQAGLTPTNLPLAISLGGDQLILDYLDNLFGDAEITIRATDKANLYVEDTFRVTVNSVQNLMASKEGTDCFDGATALTDAELQGIVTEAVGRWRDALNLDTGSEAQINNVHFLIADLPGLTLGQATAEVVLIDMDAAGWGWFVDATPFNDVEFGLSLSDTERVALATSPAFGRMDLLTVVMHEMGHVLGFEDLDPNAGALMSGTLDASTRRLNDSTRDSPKLVQMDSVAGGGVSSLLWGAKDNKASWLEDLLVDLGGRKDNPFDPTDKIKISIPGNSGGGSKRK